MFTVVILELQRRRMCTLHAVISGSDVIAGYTGALPLCVTGKSSACAEVLVEVGLLARGNEKVDGNKPDEEVLIVQVAPSEEASRESSDRSGRRPTLMEWCWSSSKSLNRHARRP